jgi:serine-type D-Ala-D-Ala carboxypeptidase/endopeptidase (penicillin-binding protein 4)
MLRIWVAVVFLFTSAYSQTDYSEVRHRISTLLKDEFFTSAAISIDVYDLTEDQQVFESDSKKLMRPASNMKILTSAASLLFLDEDYKFTTSIYYTGSILNRTLYGDLYIQGGCDPGFTSEDLDSLVISLIENNIYEISGRIFIDISMKDTLFWGNGWMWDDDPSTDAPYLSALNINNNSVRVSISPGELSQPARIRTEPETGYLNIINQTTTSYHNPNPVFVTRDWINRTNNIIAVGSIAPTDTEKTVKLNVFNPENYFMQLFLEKIKLNGIMTDEIFTKASVPERAYLLKSLERDLDTVIIKLNKVSDNLSAEMVVYALAGNYYGKPATIKNGLRLVDSLISLAGNNPREYVLADGSGVSHYNLISAELINNVLKFIFQKRGELYPKLYNSFPIGGLDGTLRSRMKKTPAENNVRAKTGTLSGVSALSGYLTNRKGNTIAFSIIIQNFRGEAKYARYLQDVICSILAGS